MVVAVVGVGAVGAVRGIAGTPPPRPLRLHPRCQSYVWAAAAAAVAVAAEALTEGGHEEGWGSQLDQG